MDCQDFRLRFSPEQENYSWDLLKSFNADVAKGLEERLDDRFVRIVEPFAKNGKLPLGRRVLVPLVIVIHASLYFAFADAGKADCTVRLSFGGRVVPNHNSQIEGSKFLVQGRDQPLDFVGFLVEDCGNRSKLGELVWCHGIPPSRLPPRGPGHYCPWRAGILGHVASSGVGP